MILVGAFLKTGADSTVFAPRCQHHPEVVEMICRWSELVDRDGAAPPVWDPSLVGLKSAKL